MTDKSDKRMNSNEADLEARLHALLAAELPWLKGSLEHQTQFKVKLGHKTVAVKGGTLRGRSDILIRHNGKPLAILELKQSGKQLTDDDLRQGLSYARLVEPMAPLVIVSNGVQTSFYDTYTGSPWAPTTRTEDEFYNRISAAGQLAVENTTAAVKTLMGINHVWVPALNAVTNDLIEQRTGRWEQFLAPFVQDFLIPRRASAHAVGLLTSGTRAIIISGPPMSGKSNVLRELAKFAASSDSVAGLMLEVDASGVFESVANVLASALDWSVGKQEARDWLRTVSNDSAAHLILLIDGLANGSASAIADLNELCSGRFGPHVHLVATVDDSALDDITRKPSGRREPNALGRLAKVLSVGTLDDGEFEAATLQLAQSRIVLTEGTSSVLTLRHPWVLRALVPGKRLLQMPEGAAVRLPPMLDIEGLNRAAMAFPIDAHTEAHLRIASDCIVDYYLSRRSSAAVLQGLSTLAVGMNELDQRLTTSGIEALRLGGYLKAGTNWADEPVWFVRTPALMAKYVATAIANQLTGWGDPEAQAEILERLSQHLPVGEVVVANALVQWASRSVTTSEATVGLLNALLAREPKGTSLEPGQKIELALHGRVWRCTVTEEGMSVETNDGPVEIAIPKEDRPNGATNLGGWLILSHLAGVHIEIGAHGETDRLDELLLLHIGQCRHVLCPGDGVDGMKEVAVHELDANGDVVCHHSGIVEPITWSLTKHIVTRGPQASGLVDCALETGSLPLLSRLFIALRYASGQTNGAGEWAAEQLATRVGPAIDRFAIC